MMKKRIIIISILVVLILGTICGFVIFNNINKTNSEIDTTSLNTDDEKIDWSSYKVEKITLNKSLTITNEGVYEITGTLEDEMITINTKKNVKLILKNASITSSNSPAIYVENSGVLVIETAKDSENYLEDGSSYNSKYSDCDGVIYSKDDLYLQGQGTLEIKSNKADGIVSKDDLKINSGTYIINSNDDAIRGTDSVYIKGGTYTINSLGDGIKSTKTDNSNKGYIYIENGKFEITSSLDGISAITKLNIVDGEFTITTGGGSENASTSSNWGMWNSKNTSNEASAKGLKSKNIINIIGGIFTLNTSDDAIHSNNYVGIKNVSLNISSGDDGIHADTELVIDSGNIDITKSYEGLESSNITINSGNVNVVTTDDGVNVAGGNDSSSYGRPGENNNNSTSDNKLVINGGIIYVNSKGDGLDSNGSIYMYGGNVIVEGPTDNGNGALDYDGEFVVDGGTLIAVGSQGMLQGISSNSKQNNIIAYLDNMDSNVKISITDSDNNEIISFTPSKSYASLVVSSNKLKTNETYNIVIDGNNYKTFTINSTTTTIGTSNSNGMNGMRGGRGMR